MIGNKKRLFARGGRELAGGGPITGVARTISAFAVLHLALTLSSAQAVTRLDSPERKAIAALRVIVGSLHSKALYGTIVKFADSKRICRTAEDEEISAAEVRLRIRERADAVDLSKVCFHKIVGFGTSTGRKAYVIELAASACDSTSEYLSSTIRNKILLRSIGLERQLLIKANGELSDSKMTLSSRLALASSHFDIEDVEFECLSGENRLRITVPIRP